MLFGRAHTHTLRGRIVIIKVSLAFHRYFKEFTSIEMWSKHKRQAIQALRYILAVRESQCVDDIMTCREREWRWLTYDLPCLTVARIACATQHIKDWTVLLLECISFRPKNVPWGRIDLIIDFERNSV